MVTAATIYLSLLGEEGLARVATTSHANTVKLVDALTAIDGVERVFTGPFFHESLLRLDRPVASVVAELSKRNIIGGIDLSDEYPELGNVLLVCATETKTDADIQAYAKAVAEIMAAPASANG